jgi:hypothetical protein
MADKTDPEERTRVIRLFCEALTSGTLHARTGELLTVEKARAELAGRPLGCFCRLDDACHVDCLLAVANPGSLRCVARDKRGPFRLIFHSAV